MYGEVVGEALDDDNCVEDARESVADRDTIELELLLAEDDELASALSDTDPRAEGEALKDCREDTVGDPPDTVGELLGGPPAARSPDDAE